jgi:hypothetical protein
MKKIKYKSNNSLMAYEIKNRHLLPEIKFSNRNKKEICKDIHKTIGLLKKRLRIKDRPIMAEDIFDIINILKNLNITIRRY